MQMRKVMTSWVVAVKQHNIQSRITLEILQQCSSHSALANFLPPLLPLYTPATQAIVIAIFLGKGAMRLALCEALPRETRPDHNTGRNVPYSFRLLCGFFIVPCQPCNTEDAGDRAYGL